MSDEKPVAPSKDKRKHTRIGYDMPVEFSLSVEEFGNLKKLGLAGTGVDISEQGLGFFTEYPLEPGHSIMLKKADGSTLTAMVRWVAELDGKFRVGVLFYK